jgi:hypothetical protein
VKYAIYVIEKCTLLPIGGIFCLQGLFSIVFGQLDDLNRCQSTLYFVIFKDLKLPRKNSQPP